MKIRLFSAGLVFGMLVTALVVSLNGAAIGKAFAVIACNSSAACDGGNNSGSGDGVLGISASGDGVFGQGPKGYGVVGATVSGTGILGEASTTTGVWGRASSSGIGVKGSSSTGTAVSGTSPNGYGMVGTSTYNIGTIGESSAYIGLYGSSDSSDGAYAYSGSGYGVESHSSTVSLFGDADGGSGNGTGVYGRSGTGFALQGLTGGGYASVYGVNTGGNGADITGSYVGAVMRAPASGGFPILATDENAHDLFYVDGAGNVYYHGSLHTFARTLHGSDATAFSPKTTSPTIEDTGSARLINGVAVVALDPAFAQTLDPRSPYHVMLTPDGDTRGLFVASKEPRGFVVREVLGGRGSFEFDYHIYGSPLGEANQRMAFLAPNASVPHAPVIPLTRPRPTIVKKPHV